MCQKNGNFRDKNFSFSCRNKLVVPRSYTRDHYTKFLSISLISYSLHYNQSYTYPVSTLNYSFSLSCGFDSNLSQIFLTLIFSFYLSLQFKTTRSICRIKFFLSYGLFFSENSYF